MSAAPRLAPLNATKAPLLLVLLSLWWLLSCTGQRRRRVARWVLDFFDAPFDPVQRVGERKRVAHEMRLEGAVARQRRASHGPRELAQTARAQRVPPAFRLGQRVCALHQAPVQTAVRQRVLLAAGV